MPYSKRVTVLETRFLNLVDMARGGSSIVYSYILYHQDVATEKKHVGDLAICRCTLKNIFYSIVCQV